MSNFFLRIFSICILLPSFIFVLYTANIFFYLMLLIILILCFFEIFQNIKQKKLKFFIYLLIIIFIFSFYKIRGSDFNTFIICLWVLSIVWLSDIGGYVIGKLIGGPKISRYSPNKTISGCCGSVLFSQFSLSIPLIFIKDFKITSLIIILQIFLSIISIFGDIFFSYIKRLNKIKDFSNLIPGHGGILDRIDGMIFVVIIFYFISLLNVS